VERRERARKLESLQKDLAQAVAEERFEDAAGYRDAIIAIEKKSATPSSP
jgi:protein-arginine kinase activator protein McsA